MFYKICDPLSSRFSSSSWEKVYWAVRDFISRIRLNVRVRWDGWINTPFFPGSSPTTACRLGVENLGVANHDEFVYPHHQWVGKDEIHGVCSGIIRLGKNGGHTILWCPRCCSIVREPGASTDDAFLKGLGVSLR